MAESLALEIVDLTKKYGSFTAVSHVGLAVPVGEVVGLLGPNGSGKSSVLHCITGVVGPSAGSIAIAGIPHRTAAAKAAMGFVPDDLALPTNLTGAEYLDMVRRLQPTSDLDLMRELLDLFGLLDAQGKLIAAYSHGMKRKLQMVAALAHRPPLLILDEPFRGLDPEAHVVLRTLVESYCAAGGGVLVATHDLAGAQVYCDAVSIIADGRVVAAGAPADLMNAYGRSSLEDVFLLATDLENRTRQLTQRIGRIRLDVAHTGGRTE